MSEEKKDAPKKTAAQRAWDVRRERTRRIAWRFGVLVGIPTLLAVLYYSFWAADEYVSVTVVAVQSPPAGQDTLGASFVANRDDDIRLVKAAIDSRSALEALSKDHGWREHYAEGGNMFSNLDADAGSEEAYSYYSERIGIKAKKGQAIRLSVRAFSPEAASKFSHALLAIAEKRLNEVALRPLVEQSKVAADRLAAAKAALAAAPEALPEQPVPAARVAAIADVEAAQALVDKLEMARHARSRFLTVVSGPSVPNEAAFPRRLWSIATVFVIAFSLMGIFSLLLGAVREHAKV